MNGIPTGGRLGSVTYVNLHDAAWDRRLGLHALDFGLDLVVDGETWGLVWAQRTETLDVQPRSVREEIPTAEPTDVSKIEPWTNLIGDRISVVDAATPCVLRLVGESGTQVWVLSGNYLDELDRIVVCGDSVLVVFDETLVRSLGL